MINFYNQVPSIYTNASRDFQYLSWLINIVLNSVKHNVDGLYDLPNTKTDTRLAELLAMTLGFKVKRKYNQEQLAALVSIIPSILRYKGTITAVTLAGMALINASGTTGDFSCEIKDGTLVVTLPKELIDINLFMDLLPYILPAGMTCHIIRNTQEKEDFETKVAYRDTLQAAWYPELEWNNDSQAFSGLAGLYSSDTDAKNIPIFGNFTNRDSSIELNEGMLFNTVIPDLAQFAPGGPLPSTEPSFTEEPNSYGTTARINRYSVEENDSGTTTIIGGKQT
jgi:hypothetical protein